MFKATVTTVVHSFMQRPIHLPFGWAEISVNGWGRGTKEQKSTKIIDIVSYAV